MLDLKMVGDIIAVAVGETLPDLTLLLLVPQTLSEERRLARQPSLPLAIKRDRFEEADRTFFDRVATGYQAIAANEPRRVKSIPASGPVEEVAANIWRTVEPLLKA